MQVLEPYDHDCKKCVWVGWFSAPGSNLPANVYLCNSKTVIIRFSSEPSDYWAAGAGETKKGPLGFGNKGLAKDIMKAVKERKAYFEQERGEENEAS